MSLVIEPAEGRKICPAFRISDIIKEQKGYINNDLDAEDYTMACRRIRFINELKRQNTFLESHVRLTYLEKVWVSVK